MYSFPDDSESCETIASTVGSNFTCHHYERDDEGTAVMVATHDESQLLSIIFRGTTDLKNVITDANFLMKPFCVPHEPTGLRRESDRSSLYCDKNEDTPLKVHSGFYDSVFSDGLYDHILKAVLSVKADHPEYRIITSGHSLGAAASVLTAVALNSASSLPPNERISSISFGCPQIGNEDWYNWVNSLRPNLTIWRYVNKHDVVTRLPGFKFYHVGHTLQMDIDKLRAYFLHYGDSENAGVPYRWDFDSLVTSPVGAYEHFLAHYMEYFKDNKPSKGDSFVDKFEKVDNSRENDSVDKSEIIKFSNAVLKFTHLEDLKNFDRVEKILEDPECKKIADTRIHSLTDISDWKHIWDSAKHCYSDITE